MKFSDKSKTTIQQIIDTNGYFALYRRPLDKEPTLIMENNGDYFHHFYVIEDLIDVSGFVVIPFDYDKGREILVINKQFVAQGYDSINQLLETIDISDENTKKADEDDTLDFEDEKEHYDKVFDIFHKAIEEEKFKKLVLTRKSMYPLPEDFDYLEAFDRACQKYPDAMVSLWYSPRTSCWLCATPEVMLKKRGEEYSTMSLAGTMTKTSNNAVVWDEKNKEEQELVSLYIRNILTDNAVEFKESSVKTIEVGNLIHQCSTFTFNLENKEQELSLLKDLYPTPAISGFPQSAKDFILNNEDYSRGYYSCIAGAMDINAETDLYINLRTAKIGDKYYYPYAGGGILLASNKNEEWKEIEAKMKVIRDIIEG